MKGFADRSLRAPTLKGWREEKPQRKWDKGRQRQELEKWNLGTERHFKDIHKMEATANHIIFHARCL